MFVILAHLRNMYLPGCVCQNRPVQGQPDLRLWTLGPILCLLYINDLEEGVTSKILKFADDTIHFLEKIKGNGDKQQLQDDIDKLIKWSEKWQMLFNFQKCKCLHAGHGNTGVNYEIGGTIQCKTVKEKDLGVTINANMKVSQQCRIAAYKGKPPWNWIQFGKIEEFEKNSR